MIRCKEDLLTIDTNQLYLYGAKNVALEITEILESNGRDFEGYIVTKPENNKQEVCGRKVYGIDDISDKSGMIGIILACAPEYKREIAGNLLKKGFIRLYMLEDDFAVSLRVQARARQMFLELSDSDYELVIPMYLERWQALIKNKMNNDTFKLRTEVNRVWELTHCSDEYIFKADHMKKEFESLWGKYTFISELTGTQKTQSSIRDFANIYSIRCHVDKKLYHSQPENYLTDIQAGAAIAPEIICDCRDDLGDNISNRNREFSECSAFYWVWKNALNKEYIGCFHYRRRLDISEDELKLARENDADLISTVPCTIYPSIKQFFLHNFLYQKDWVLMIEAIEKLHPEYLASTLHVAEGHYYLANNIFIMKTKWYDCMCRFVFDILLYIDDFYKNGGFYRQDRYAGYIFEYLYSVFVYHHAKEMNIIYADMKFLG